MRSLRFFERLPATLLVGALLATAPAAAGVDIDLSAAVRVSDDVDLFFGISSRYFDRDPRVVQAWGARYGDPDDLSVALFIHRHSGEPLDRIHFLRRSGMSWWDISVRFGMPVDVWFVPVHRDPGPPYGKAYGHWKKHKHHPHHAVALTDVDLRNLVVVRMVHEYYNVPVDVAMEWRASGKNVQTLMTTEYHKRHKGHDKSVAKNKDAGGHKSKDHPGKGHGKNK